MNRVAGCILLVALGAAPLVAAEPLDIAPVWAGHPVGFALLTRGKQQLVAFYDADRRMTIGARPLGQNHWQLVHLPSQLGWDSHSYVTMAVDSEGQIHVSGNMHCQPLVYFRTERPGDITSFHPLPAMVGRNEKRCTYPRFLCGPRGELIFTYRDGRSGSGDQFCNVYDAKAKIWRRLMESPLFSGGGKMNAYFIGPEQDKAGVFHICWVWRDTPDCATNHDLCYARSKDLVRWETSDGRPLSLPITLATAEVVDPVPAGGGMINGNTRIGFDAENRPVISYHKFDAQGKTQLFSARRETSAWHIYQTSDWDYRWEFRGGGTIRFETHVGPVVAGSDGSLTQTWQHVKYGSGNWKLDPKTLKPVGKTPPRKSGLPKGFSRVESTWAGMEVRSAADLGAGDNSKVRYVLRWEMLPSNRDRPRPGPLPPPTMLRLYQLEEP
ncbi:MAG: BNR repeat-containing protein [Thermoguttaceae bacterium]